MSTEAQHTPIPPRPAQPPSAATEHSDSEGPSPVTPPPPPPPASARFPDAPPYPARRPTPPGRPATTPQTPAQSAVHPRPSHRPAASPAETPAETTRRLRPIPAEPRRTPATSSLEPTTPVTPNPAHSWTAPHTSGGTFGPARPMVTFGEPEAYDDHARTGMSGALIRRRTLAAAVCLVLGAGLIGGAVTGSWLAGGSGEGGERGAFAAAGSLWHSVPVDQLFPPTVQGRGAGPGSADRTWTRIAVAPDSGCADAFDPLLRKALAPVGCERLLRATYTDATESYVTTVGLLFTKADATAMRSLDARFEKEGLGRRTDLMPRPYAAKDTVAADFGDEQRASWTVSVLTDAPVVVYAVSGWADARTVDEPQPAAEAMRSGATTAVAQAGLGHEAKGLADRVERGLRKSVTSSSEQPS
ncbi:hypothetical protein SSP24_21610 [Streptomyces spinoverrucosus]|uniref:Uncharacterized protein n=1 Tax=Streptomyces spinoverrucosus TaxID=284043 RepID=A0A4Y3VHK6_9ACTN|nr:hypothetical protein [Streptomyces spinoverrucosus]GEC04506.1 hypothetical protein SSP24_21610 [Streptomyces spinoverrucosus]GHB57581.1 hypothetical protein GCM10010397_29850 [Streptomyces spinoverrucosus]